MATVQRAMFFFFLLFTFLKLSEAAVYKVGDSEGWTIIGNVSYGSWARTKSFHVGDVLIFEYNKKFHNVLEVTRDQYRSCNATAPISTFSTGNDSITIKSKHQFFICGFSGHCEAGQKVDIRRADIKSGPSPSPSPLGSSGSASALPPTSAPGLKNQVATSKGKGVAGFGTVWILYTAFVL